MLARTAKDSACFNASPWGFEGTVAVSSTLFFASTEAVAVFACTGGRGLSPVPRAADLDCASHDRTNPDRSLNPNSLTSSSSCFASSPVSRNVTFVVDNDDARLGRAIYFRYRNESLRVKAFRPTKWAPSSCSRTRLCPTKWPSFVH